MALIVALMFSQSCMAQEPSAKDVGSLLRQADMQLSEKAYDEAYRLAAEAEALARESAGVQQRAAEIMYLAGFSKESLPLFDRAVALAPASAPQNWQRGIALCSAGDFQRGAEQFKTHHDVNPDDVENSAWYFLCIAKTKGMEAARKTVIPSRGDSRQPMMSVLKMLKGEIEPKEVIAAAEAVELEGRALKTAKFYADLYVGLYYDSMGEQQKAAEALKRSLSYEISGYMVDTARVYLKDRLSDAAEPKAQEAK